MTTIDHKKRRLSLRRQAGRPNRISDVEPFMHLSGITGASSDRAFTITGKIHNRGPRRVRDLTFEAALLDTNNKVLARLKGQVKRLDPGKAESFTLQGDAPKELVKYR